MKLTIDEFLAAERQAILMLNEAGLQHTRGDITALTFDLIAIWEEQRGSIEGAVATLKRNIAPAPLANYLASIYSNFLSICEREGIH